MKENKDYLKLFKVGDIVYHYKYGRCWVVETSEKNELYLMKLQLISPTDEEITIISATKEIIKALSFQPYDFDNLDKFTRNRPIKDKTVVFVRYQNRGKWYIRRAFKDNPFVTNKTGKTYLRCYTFQSLREIEKKPDLFDDYPIWSLEMPDFDEEDKQQEILK